MEDQQRAADKKAAANSGQAATTQPPARPALAAPRDRLFRCSLACGITHQRRRSRSPATTTAAASAAAIAALLPPTQWSATAWHNERGIGSMQAAHLVDGSCRTCLRRFHIQRDRLSKLFFTAERCALPAVKCTPQHGVRSKRSLGRRSCSECSHRCARLQSVTPDPVRRQVDDGGHGGAIPVDRRVRHSVELGQ